MGKKGLSAEQKQQKLLELFHEAEAPFTLKELEKGAKSKGLNSMLVKGLVKDLVDNNKVWQEKIGASNIFWSFPSEASQLAQTEGGRLAAELKEAQAAKGRAEAELAALEANVENADELELAQKTLGDVTNTHAQLSAEIAKLSGSSVEDYKEAKEAARAAKDAANRWIDNIFTLQSHLANKFEGHGDAVKALFKNAGVKDDLDNIP